MADGTTVTDARPAPATDDPAGVDALRSVLADAGYTAEAVREALATEVSTSRDSDELPLYLRLLPEGSRLTTMIKLFMLGVPVDVDEACAALSPLALDRLGQMGVVRVDTGLVSGSLEIVPTEKLMIACDPYREELLHADHVLGVSPPAKVLAALTIRALVGSALDVGSGNGVQALLAAEHASRVVAVDINPRALRFTAFNAMLNRVANVERRQGDLFDPVEGERFDLVVCNPPYVVSPESALWYRDSGQAGDAFCARLVRQMPAHLNEGGFAHALVSWVHETDEDCFAPLESWVEESGCDALLLHYFTHDPLQYAAGWNRKLRHDQAAYAAALDRWLDYYRRLGIEAISWGTVVLRRRSGRNWVWRYTPSSERMRSASDHLLRLFAAQDYLTALESEAELLDAFLALVDEHELEQTLRLAGGDALVGRTILSLRDGVRCEVSLDEAAVRVLALLDGRRPLRAVVADAGRAAPATMDGDRFLASALPIVRRLIELGFVVPAATTPMFGRD